MSFEVLHLALVLLGALERVEGRSATGTRVERPESRFEHPTSGLRPSTPSPPSVRVLSLPCASGEEPYSLAMALLDAGVPAPAFAIDAADISANALGRAARAVYLKNSFRGRELRFRERHFQLTPEGYALSSLVRQCVRFECGNALDHDFLAGRAPYHFIFCRNLLIYFDRARQSLLLGKLRRWLAADGVLFVGPAELPLAVANGFVCAGRPMAFACHKAVGHVAEQTTPRGGKSLENRRVESGSRPSTLMPRFHPAEAPTELHVARQHAAAGRLAEAAALCQAHLSREGPSAHAYYLLGRVKDAGHDPEAIACYRKALYLAPKHYEALIHLTRALEKAGDMGAARLTQRRAERAVAELKNPKSK